jgi:uncharacterized membrane protein YeaQ/YmgE (transglycosylase-associated protein family)
MAVLHKSAAIGAVAGMLALLPGFLRRRDAMAGVIVAVLAGLVGNAAITGALSGPHDRYQSRVMWLPVCALLLATARRSA